jgi:hypothetical protein
MVHRREALGAHRSHVSLDTDCLGADTHTDKYKDPNPHQDRHEHTDGDTHGGQHRHGAAHTDRTNSYA